MNGWPEQLKRLWNALSDEKNRAAAAKVLREVRRILRHILPREKEGYLHIGLSDPYLTGKLMEFFAVLYPAWADDIEVTPFFDRPEFSGRLRLKGRVRLLVPLLSVLKLYLDKTIRGFLKGNGDHG